MFFLYLLALLFSIGGVIAYFKFREINWIEVVANIVLSFSIAGIFHLCVIHGMTTDIETWSGQIIQARQFSAWKEYYEYAVYTTEYYEDSKGNTHSRQVFDHWEPATRWHNEHWESYSNIDTVYSISKEHYNQTCKNFGQVKSVEGRRWTFEHNSKMISGDPNDYVSINVNNYIEPITKITSFKNKIKAAPSVFSFIKVDEKIPVYKWPENQNPFVSERLLGHARNMISTLAFDQMNARLGPFKKVNVIMIGLGEDSMLGQYQRAKFIGGKKNDLVICYGGKTPSKADWAFVFGWTDSEIVKQNLQSIVLNNPINDSILDLIEKEVRANYVKKNWHDFDYLTIEIPSSYYWIYMIIIIIIEVGYWWFVIFNDCGKSWGEEKALSNNNITDNYKKKIGKKCNNELDKCADFIYNVKQWWTDIKNSF